jgi:peptidyl-prolyl cis-trans isomerase D
MLRGIRTASANWFGRAVMGVVMGLLALSFAVWGINDIFRGFGRSTIAKVGHTEIPIELFRQTYDERLEQLGRQIGRPLTPEQAKAFGLDRQVLGELVAESALDQRAAQMRLGMSDATVVQHITADKAFQGPTGAFDRGRFEMLLRNVGYSEQRFVSEQRRLMLRREIVETLTANVPVPKAWLDAINEFQNQQRSIQYVAFGAAQAGDIPQPTPEQLSKFFDARKVLFRAPEYRKIVVVQATPAELAKWMEVPEDDIKKAFDERRSRYITPEKRHVEEIVFPTMAEADAAGAQLKGGLSFTALAAQRGLKEQDIDLGTVTKSDLVDPAVADAAFALKEGEVSDPIKGRFGNNIVTVTKIVPEEKKSLAEVTPQIRTDIAMERAKAEVAKLHDQVEDARAGGAALEEAAKQAKLPVVTYDAVDRSGRDASGKPIANLADANQVVSAAFASDVGVENDPIEADGGYIWYDVAAITPAHDRSLDEVKKDVEDLWRQDQIATRLQAKANDLLGKLKAGNPFDDLAKADGLTLNTADKLTRGKPTEQMTAPVINAVFRTAKDGFGSVAGGKAGDWIVFRVTDVTTPSLDANSPDAKRINETVLRQMDDDFFTQYVAWLENRLGTSINQDALAQALGNSAPETD